MPRLAPVRTTVSFSLVMSVEPIRSGLMEVTEPVGRLLQAVGILMDQHLGLGEGGAELGLHLVGDLVRLVEGDLAVHLQVQLDEGARPRGPGAQVVQRQHLGLGRGRSA